MNALLALAEAYYGLKLHAQIILPENPAKYFVDTVAELGGVPIKLVTDLDTENGLVLSQRK